MPYHAWAWHSQAKRTIVPCYRVLLACRPAPSCWLALIELAVLGRVLENAQTQAAGLIGLACFAVRGVAVPRNSDCMGRKKESLSSARWIGARCGRVVLLSCPKLDWTAMGEHRGKSALIDGIFCASHNCPIINSVA